MDYTHDQQDPGNVVTFKCMGTGAGDFRYLDGHTKDGSVGLATTTAEPFSGTKWLMVELPGGSYAFQCLGEGASDEFYRGFLDGHTSDGIVTLAPTTEGAYSGTHWYVADTPR